MRETPCKNCKDRKVGCHAVCENYIEWRKMIDEINVKRFEQKRLREFDFESRNRK